MGYFEDQDCNDYLNGEQGFYGLWDREIQIGLMSQLVTEKMWLDKLKGHARCQGLDHEVSDVRSTP